VRRDNATIPYRASRTQLAALRGPLRSCHVADSAHALNWTGGPFLGKQRVSPMGIFLYAPLAP